MKQRIAWALALFGAVAALSATGVAQSEQTSAQTVGRGGLPVVKVQDLVLQHYESRYSDPDLLARLAQSTVGRNFHVEERGGIQSIPVNNISQLGGNLIVYDTQEYVQRVMEALDRMDQPTGASTTPAVIEYVPRYLPVNAVVAAVESRTNQISVIRDRGVVVIRDTETGIAEAKALLARIDKPEQQVMITCYLLEGYPMGDLEEEGGIAIPTELLTNLKELVPQYDFASIGFALLQTSTAPGSELQIRIDGEGRNDYTLEFIPVAFDQQTASMSVQQCQLLKDTYVEMGSGAQKQVQFSGQRPIFTTNTVFRGGEYTVLGATGAYPTFLVVRITPVGAKEKG